MLPMFVADGITESRPIRSMPGVVAHTRDSLRQAAADAVAAGVGGLMLFGVPRDADKDATGSVGVSEDGILNVALRDLAKDIGDDAVLMADTCLDEFTDHGHCGIVDGSGRVDNDATNARYVELAVAQAESGADVVGPSGMMDGQVAAIRDGLDAAGHTDTVILAYAAKFASGFYGPFREAVASSLSGDRRTYQQDPGNAREALHEVELDIDEGADIVMVKPAMGYLDVVRAAADISPVPVAAYQVSGEYSMISAAAANGWIDLQTVALETLTSIRRAGADIVLTYWAADVGRLAGVTDEQAQPTARPLDVDTGFWLWVAALPLMVVGYFVDLVATADRHLPMAVIAMSAVFVFDLVLGRFDLPYPDAARLPVGTHAADGRRRRVGGVLRDQSVHRRPAHRRGDHLRHHRDRRFGADRRWRVPVAPQGRPRVLHQVTR